MAAILSSAGGKFRADALDGVIPHDWLEISSPFLGAAHRERKLAQSGVRIFGSDVQRPLIETWRQLLVDPERVADLVALYTPVIHSKSRFYRVKDNLNFVNLPYDQAALFLIANQLSYNGMVESGGYSEIRHGKFSRNLARYVSTVRNFRCPNLYVDWLDFREALWIHRDKPAICDPPYDLPGGNCLYGSPGQDFNHEALFKILSRRDAWLCCYNPSPRILALYRGYRILDFSGAWRYSMTRRASTEILIISHDVVIPAGWRNYHTIS